MGIVNYVMIYIKLKARHSLIINLLDYQLWNFLPSGISLRSLKSSPTPKELKNVVKNKKPKNFNVKRKRKTLKRLRKKEINDNSN